MDLKIVKELHKMGNAEVKEKLEKEFPEVFQTSELEKAIEKLGEKDKEVIKLRKLQSLEDIESNLAYQKLVVIIKSLNDGWIRKEEDYFYYPWFYVDKFRLRFVAVQCSRSLVGAPLFYKSEELAQEALDKPEILGYYKTYMEL